MKKIVYKSAKIANAIAKPAKNLILHNSRRTRIIVQCGAKILLVKSSLSDQKWSLPGGGLKKNEDPIKGVLRELREEAGLSLKADQVKLLGELKLPRDKKWPQVHMIFFFAKLSQKIEPHVSRPLEIVDARWSNLKSLPEARSTTVDEGLALLKELN